MAQHNTKQHDSKRSMPLGKINYIIMAAALALVIVGFVITGSGEPSAEQFNPDIFGTARIVVGPTMAFLGFVAMFFGIIYKSKK